MEKSLNAMAYALLVTLMFSVASVSVYYIYDTHQENQAHATYEQRMRSCSTDEEIDLVMTAKTMSQEQKDRFINLEESNGC